VCVGREKEIAVIDAALADARAGRGGILVITGEPGIGKSRLAEEVVTRAEWAGMLTARGHCLDDPGVPPLWPWLRVARGISDLGELLDNSADIGSDAAARFGLFEAVASELTTFAGEHGLVVVLEDMHWADASSIRLVRHLAGDMWTTPLMLVLTARDRPVVPAWSSGLPELLRAPNARSLPLSGLSTASVAQWLRSTPDRAEWIPLAQQLRLRTNGNPFYLRLLTSDAPSRLDEVVARRADLRAVVMAQLNGLSPQCRRALEAAALLGESLDLPILTDVTGAPATEIAEAIAEASSAGVLKATEGGAAFIHALVRDGVAASIEPGRRTELHRAVALALERDARAGMAGFIAEHWRLAGGTDAVSRCVLWSRRAAAQAATGFDHEGAIKFADLALRQAQSLALSPAQTAAIAVELAEQQMATGELRAALLTCEYAADLAERAGDARLLARAALVINGVGDDHTVRVINGLSRRAMAALPPDEKVLRARLLARQAVAAAESGGGHHAADLAAAALAAAERSGDANAEWEALAARHLSIAIPETLEEREQLARRAIDIALYNAEPMAALWGHLWMTEVHLQRGHLDRIDGELLEIDIIAARTRSPLARAPHPRRPGCPSGRLRAGPSAQRRIDVAGSPGG
jgi:hypothetical protein